MFSSKSIQRKSLYVGVTALLFNIFFGKVFGPFAFVILTLFLFLLFTVHFLEERKKIRMPLVALGGMLLLSNVVIISRDNAFVVNLFKFISFIVLAIQVYVLGNDRTTVSSLFELVTAPVRSFAQYVQGGIRIARLVLSSEYRKENLLIEKQQSTSGKKALIVGVLVSVPILAVLVGLLSQGDPIFSYYVRDILNILDLERVIFTGFIFALIAPLIFWRKKEWLLSLSERIPQNKFLQEFTVVMSLVALTIGAFLVVQWQYIFVSVPSEISLSQFGVKTYSEYVTKGFIELLQVAVLLYSLIWAGLLLLRKDGFKHKLLMTMQVVVLAEFVLFAMSVLRRVHLYQTYHGLTLIRVYGSVFLLWLLVMIGTLAARHIVRKPILRYEIVLTVLILFFVGFFNADEFIAVSSPPTVNDRVDYIYLSRLSADGYKGWSSSFAYAGTVLNNPRYDTGAIIHREDRRDIAYSGYILWHTMRHYHDLILSHGTDKEVLEYMQMLVNTELKASESRMQAYNTDLLVAEKNNVKRVIQDAITYEQDRAKRLQKMHQQIEKHGLTGKLDENVERLAIFPSEYIDAKVMFDTGLNGYDYGSTDSSFYDVYVDYYFYQNLVKKRDSLSKAFAWNEAQLKTFQKMKKEIPLEEVLQLQNRYFALRKKILNQPADERHYDQDVSLNGLLVD